ncbi:V-type ATP synthase subunit E [Candidatus Bipolaricaulota sp. J31]
MTEIRVSGDLRALVEHVLRQARERAAREVEEAEKRAGELIQRAEAEAKAREEELVHAGLEEIKRARRRLVSQAELELKEELLTKKVAIVEDLVSALEAELVRRCRQGGPEYLRGLVAFVRDAVAAEGETRVVLYLAREDLERYRDELRHALSGMGVREVELREGDIPGGVIVELPRRGLQFDGSLTQVMRELRPSLEKLLAELVFAPAEGGDG